MSSQAPENRILMADTSRISIAHRSRANKAAVTIEGSFMRNALFQFCGQYRNEVISTEGPTNPNGGGSENVVAMPKVFTIMGGDASAVQKVLAWMLDAYFHPNNKHNSSSATAAATTTATTTTPFQQVTDTPFFTYLRVRDAAEIMQIPALQQSMNERIDAIAAAQVSSDDAWAVYTWYGAGSAERAAVADSVARAYFEGRLLSRQSYDEVRVQWPDFKRDVNDRLAELKKVKLEIDARAVEGA